MPASPPPDTVIERFQEHGTPVFTHFWDTNYPGGGAGTNGVLELDGQYIYYVDDLYESPIFDSLRDAITAGEVNYVNSGTERIECDAIPHAEIASLLVYDEEDPTQGFLINGVAYTAEGKLKSDVE